MSTPELLNIVQETFEVLKGGKASLGDILSLVQKFSVNNAVKVHEVFEKAIVRVENEVVSLLPDGQKAAFSENLALVRKFVSEHASLQDVKTGLLAQLKKLISRLLPGLCGNGGPLPELPTQVVKIREVVQQVADLPAVKAVEQAVGVSVVQEAVKAVEKAVDVSVVQKAVEGVVQKAVEQATEVVGTHQVKLEVPEHELPAPPSSTAVEQNSAPVPQVVQDNKMD